jgi:hypothetical protein
MIMHGSKRGRDKTAETETKIQLMQDKKQKMPFGPSMIALLVGALFEATFAEWKVHGDFPKRECPLDTDREAYSTAILRKFEYSEDDETEEESA